MRIARVLPWALLAALVVFSVAVYPMLPAEIPRSIGLSGQVEHTMKKSPIAWALLPIIAILTQVLIEWIRGSLPRNPDRFNFPGKDDLLKLPAEYHPPVVARMQWFMDAVSFATNAIMIAVQLTMWHTARGGSSQTATLMLLMVSVLMTPVLFLLLQRVTNEVDAAKRKWESRRNPLAS